uniref:Protein NDRG3 n=1 Tax=Angiostrongylus cantonensis TaxID=6313 RepID=A0A0K0CSW0_ANGCA
MGTAPCRLFTVLVFSVPSAAKPVMSSMEMHAFSNDLQPLVDNPSPEMNAANVVRVKQYQAQQFLCFMFSVQSWHTISFSSLSQERVDTVYGKVKVSIYGDRTKHPMITFHDLGLDSESNFQNFFQFVSIAEFTEKFCVYNINAPGQEVDAQTFPDSYDYPSMDGLAKIVETVVNHFDLQSVIAFGVGVGANVLLRYAVRDSFENLALELLNQRRLDALILVNCVANAAGWIEWAYQKMNIRYLRGTGMNTFTVDYLMWHHFGRRLGECSPDIVRQYRVYFQHLSNPKNLAMFIESYMNRTAIPISRDGQSGSVLNVPVLQIVGAGSPFVNDTVDVNTKLDPSRSDWIKANLNVSDACGLVLDDRPEIVTESVILFLQGLGFCRFFRLEFYVPTMNVMKLMKKIQDTQNGSCFAVSDSVDEC